MTNLVTIVLLNVAANSTIFTSNDLVTWRPYVCTFTQVPAWRMVIDPVKEGRVFWKYESYCP